jgi:short-subunit dehydrogenase
MWPPWPISLFQRNHDQEAESSDKEGDEGFNPSSASVTEYEYPSTAMLMLAYLRQRMRIWSRQCEEIGSQVWMNLPPALPPLILMASIPRKIVTEDPRTGQEITRRIFPVFSNPLARSMIAFGLGFAVLSWSQQELKRKRKLTPLPLAISYESVSRVFLPPFLPEDVPEPELEALDKVVAATNADGDEANEEEENDNMLSKVSPKIRKHISELYATASNPHKNIQYYLQEWKRGRLARKREAAKIRRLRIFDELVALQALKRKAAAKHRGKVQSTTSETGYALVTGASEGIGRAIAVELARWEIPVLLVARNADKLMSLAYDLEACYGVKCCVLKADLSEIDAAEKIHEVTTKAGITVDILVNNAGIAYEGLAVDMTLSDVERMIILNSITYAKLCQLYGSDMKRRRRGRILNVSSMAGLCNASPNTAVYGATKAFEKSLSLGLAKEMEPYGVGVTCLLPGAVQGTQFRHRSGTKRALCWSMPFYPKAPEAVAHQGVVSVLDGDSQTIPGWQNRVFATIIRPIIPQRFEIMTVQAAFSPFHLPGIKELFGLNKQDEVREESVDENPFDSTSSLKEEVSSWIPLLEPRYKAQPVPRVLKLPQPDQNDQPSEMLEKQETSPQGGDETGSVMSSENFQEEKTNSTIDTTKEKPREVQEKSPISNDNGGLESTTNVTTAEQGAIDEAGVPPKRKVVTTLEVEDEVIVKIEKEVQQEPRQEHCPDPDPPQADETEASVDKEKSKAIDGRRQGTTQPPMHWDEEEDTTFSPNLGPVDLLEHRRFTFPKQTEVTRSSNASIVIV